jgi:hypothetical protein
VSIMIRMLRKHPRGWLAAAAVASTALTVGLATGPSALAATGSATVARPEAASGIAGWTTAGSYLEPTLTSNEGVATVDPPGGSAYELYRGTASIPLSLAVQGWTHIGDPDSASGYIVDAYQSSTSTTKKMYRVTTPSGAAYQYTHTLVSGELSNNSFDTISPDTQWMVSGEWGTMSHLQIYPTPALNSQTSPTGGTLNLAGYIQLDHQVNDVQSCDFLTPAALICASDDSSETLFSNAKPLLEITLPGPLTGQTATGHVIDLGSIPQSSICSGSFEAEGVDYDTATGVLRVEIVQPSVCEVATTVYEYKES